MHLKTKHFKIVGSISRFSSEDENSSNDSSDDSDSADDIFDDNDDTNDISNDIANDIADGNTDDIADDNNITDKIADYNEIPDDNAGTDDNVNDTKNADVIANDNASKNDIADDNDTVNIIAVDKNNAIDDVIADEDDIADDNDNVIADDNANVIPVDYDNANVIADENIDVIEIEDDDDDIPDFDDLPAINPIIKEEICETVESEKLYPNKTIEKIYPTLQHSGDKIVVKSCEEGKGKMKSENPPAEKTRETQASPLMAKNKNIIKGQLISKGLFDVRISALTSKKRSDQKNKITLYPFYGLFNIII